MVHDTCSDLKLLVFNRYKLMPDCWIKNPEDRPSFGQLQARISVHRSVVNSSDPQPEYLEIM